MPGAWAQIPEGEEGIRQIVGRLNALKRYYGTVPAIRSCALQICRARSDDDQAGHVTRLARFVRTSMVYVKDPLNAEFTQSPDVLLLQIHKTGRAEGDCDDHVLLFASLVESLGIYCEIVAVKGPGSATFDHVIATANPHGVPLDFDMCAKEGLAPVYSDKLFAP